MSRSEYLPLECWRGMYSVMQRANVNALRVCLDTGMRIDDVLSLTFDNFSKVKGGYAIDFVAKKTGKQGRAIISCELVSELKSCAGPKSEWVFPGRNGAKHRTRQAVYKDLKKATALLGVQGQISPHSARKTFAVELRKKSGVAEVQKALQHTDAETTNLYAFADVAARHGANGVQIAEIAEIIAEKVVEKLKKG